MADRCYFTLTEKASVNKRPMSSEHEKYGMDFSILSIKSFHLERSAVVSALTAFSGDFPGK